MKATDKLLLQCALTGLALFPGFGQARCQTQPNEPDMHPQATEETGTIHGIVKSGNMPIPGAAVTISAGSSAKTISTWTDVDGSFSVTVPSYGSYTVRVQMVAFAVGTQQVAIDAAHTSVPANFELTLLSRTREVISSTETSSRSRSASARIPEPFRATEHGCSGCRQRASGCCPLWHAGSWN